MKGIWFTRGRTIQELPAPALVIFFDCEWNRIGSKWALLEEIWAATRIEVLYLNCPDLSRVSVATKISWISRRKTSRVEDIAYCLMQTVTLSGAVSSTSARAA